MHLDLLLASAWLPLVAGPLLFALTFALWRSGRWTTWRIPLGIAWTWVWVELLLLALNPPTRAPKTYSRDESWGPLGWAVTADMMRRADPPGVPVIQVVGDSFAAGVGANKPGTLVGHLRRLLSKERPDVVVRDHGRPGASFATEVYTWALIDRFADADVVLWIFVLNDLGFDCPSCEDLIGLHHQANRIGSPLLQWWRQRRTSAALTRASEQGYLDALAPDTEIWRGFEEDLARVTTSATDRDARFLFVVFPILHQLDDYPFRDVHRRLVATARNAGAEPIDLLPAFEGRRAADLWYHPTDHHPNAEGYRIAAEVLARAITAQPLPDSPPSDCEASTVLTGRLSDVERALCRDGSPSAMVDTAERLLGRPSRERFPPGAEERTIAELLSQAWQKTEGDTAVRARAEALMTRMKP